MSLVKKIFIGIFSFSLLVVLFIVWLFIEMGNDNDSDKPFLNIEIPSNLKFKKPIEYLSHQEIDSLKKLEVDESKVLVVGTGYSGYDFYMWHKPTEKGELYIKAFELTQNTQLSEWKLSARTKNVINELGEDYRLYIGRTVIDEGTFEHYYPTRFELWFKSLETGSEKKLAEEKYLIDGWDR